MGRSKDNDLIIFLREDISKLRADQKRAMSMMRRHRSELQGVGRQISTSIASAFGAYAVINGIGRSVKSVADLEFQMSKVRAVSGANEKQFKDLNQNALDLGRATKFTAGEIGELQLELSKLGFSPEKILASTDAIRKLATVADAGLGESAKTMAGTLNSFNLSASESNRVANVMAESFSKSALDLEKFTSATSNSGSIANVFGHTLEQNTARMGALVDANIDASKAGTDLRKIYLELNKHGLTYDQAMNKIIESTDKGGMAQKLFGDRAVGAAVILAEQQQKVNKLTSELSDANIEMNEMVGIMEDNLITDFAKLGSAIDGAAQRGGGLIDVFRAISQTATGMINSLGTTDLDKQFQRAGIEVGITGPSQEEMFALLAFNQELKKTVEIEKDRIVTGADIFGDISISSLKAADRISILNKRLASMKQHKFYPELKKEIEAVIEGLKSQGSEIESISKKWSELTEIERKEFNVLSKKNLALAEQKQFLEKISKYQQDTSFNEFNASHGLGDFESFEKQLEQMILTGGEANAAIGEEFGKALEEASAQAEAYQQEMSAVVDSLNATINQALVEATSAFIQGFVNGGIEQAFAGLLEVIGQGLIRLGETLIAFGVALEAFKNAPGPVKIAAGAAAIVAGSLVKKAAASLAASPSRTSIAGGGASGPTGRFQNDRTGQSQPVKLEGEFVISGRNLRAMINQEEKFDRRNVG